MDYHPYAVTKVARDCWVVQYGAPREHRAFQVNTTMHLIRIDRSMTRESK